MLIRDTWNTDIVDELRPQKDDLVVYKTRYSGFYNTDLDAILKRRGMRTLIMMGSTTSVCVESTLRDAMFRDYSPVLLADCTSEPIGQELSRSNHEASLFLIREAPFGAVILEFGSPDLGAMLHPGEMPDIASRGQDRSSGERPHTHLACRVERVAETHQPRD